MWRWRCCELNPTLHLRLRWDISALPQLYLLLQWYELWCWELMMIYQPERRELILNQLYWSEEQMMIDAVILSEALHMLKYSWLCVLIAVLDTGFWTNKSHKPNIHKVFTHTWTTFSTQSTFLLKFQCFYSKETHVFPT